MLKQLIDFFESFITDFSWRRLGLFLGLVLTVVFFFALYENYTQSFGLAKLEKQISLVERLYSLSEKNSNVDSDLKAVYENVLGQLSADIGVSGGLVPAWFAKLVSSVIAWSIFGFLLVSIPDKSTNKESKALKNKGTIFGMLVVGIPCAFVSALIPSIGSWFNYIIVPFAQIFLVSVIALVISRK